MWSAVPVYICWAERGCSVRACAPRLGSSRGPERRARSREPFAQAAAHLHRHRHVDRVGDGLDERGRRGRARSSSEPPAPVLVTLRTGQPKLMSTMSAPAADDHPRGLGHRGRARSRRSGRPAGARRGRSAGSRACARCRRTARRPKPSRSTPARRRSGGPGGGTPAPRRRPSAPARPGSGPRRRRCTTSRSAGAWRIASRRASSDVLRRQAMGIIRATPVSLRPLRRALWGAVRVCDRARMAPAEEADVEKDVILTPEGYEKLKSELEELDHQRAARSPSASARPASSATSPRTPSTTTPRTSRRMLEAQIAQLEERLRAARVIDAEEVSTDVVVARLEGHAQDVDHGDKATYQIVGSAEADPDESRLSNESPIGRAHHRAQEGRDGRRRRARRRRSRSRSSPSRPRSGRDRTTRSRTGSRRPHARSPTSARAPRGARGRRGSRATTLPPGRARHGAARPGQGRVPRPRGPLGAPAAAGRARRARRGALRARVRTSTLGDVVGVEGEAVAAAAASCRCSSTSASCWRRACGRCPTSSTASPTSRRATASATSTCWSTREVAREFAAARARGHRAPPLPRRARLPRGRDAGAAAALRRRAGAAVHHAPQRARPRPLPAHRRPSCT